MRQFLLFLALLSALATAVVSCELNPQPEPPSGETTDSAAPSMDAGGTIGASDRTGDGGTDPGAMTDADGAVQDGSTTDAGDGSTEGGT